MFGFFYAAVTDMFTPIYIQEKHFSTENGYDVMNKADDKVGYRMFSCSIVLNRRLSFNIDFLIENKNFNAMAEAMLKFIKAEITFLNFHMLSIFSIQFFKINF